VSPRIPIAHIDACAGSQRDLEWSDHVIQTYHPRRSRSCSITDLEEEEKSHDDHGRSCTCCVRIITQPELGRSRCSSSQKTATMLYSVRCFCENVRASFARMQK
jgi:hypothetical protein